MTLTLNEMLTIENMGYDIPIEELLAAADVTIEELLED